MSMDFEKKTLPLGYEDFKEVIDEQLYFVDKTMFIRDIIRNKSKNNLITRPRRFGKTLNLSMLKYFFGITEKRTRIFSTGLSCQSIMMSSDGTEIHIPLSRFR